MIPFIWYEMPDRGNPVSLVVRVINPYFLYDIGINLDDPSYSLWIAHHRNLPVNGLAPGHNAEIVAARSYGLWEGKFYSRLLPAPDGRRGYSLLIDHNRVLLHPESCTKQCHNPHRFNIFRDNLPDGR